MKRYREADLFLWGDELYKLQEWANEHGDGVLQKWVDYQQKVGGGKPGHHVLCPEMPLWLGKISTAARKLAEDERKAVMAFYSAQLIDGQRPTDNKIALEISMNIKHFKKNKRNGRNKLLRLLNS